ncbi:hypothetical protein BGZ99_009572 [Dissophora globulifera]|uniref:F-box domain-containing protein n=1 Tax=Dissophora globulifera TaxID=979702 RepID=A0A9P6R894_9FUNG|nr:hypothetical protein BGZ99_009572 [Dissophora globulifera]
MTSPFDLPEMLLYIARFVDHKDLLACVRVCRQWKESFTPHIWTTVIVPEAWESSPAFPPLDLLQKNARFVRELTLQTSQGLSSFLENCSSLKTLVVYGKHVIEPQPGLWVELTDLIRRNPLLEWIVLGFDRTSGPSASFLQALPEACPNLKRYESSRGKYNDPAQVEALMRAFSHMSTVSTRYEEFANSPQFKQWTFPRLYELTLKDAKGVCTQSQVDFVSRCPNLRHLKWSLCRETMMPVQEFCERVPTACPLLCQLQMDGCGLPDPDDVGRLVDSLSRLELLSLCGNRITNRTFSSLGRHFGTLQSLDVIDCFYVKSWMVQQILENCPNLIKLAMPVLRMRDIVQGKDWAAVRLRHLQVNLVQTLSTTMKSVEVEEQWTTFERLSKLTQLRHLAVGSRSWTRREGLIFRMDCGVDQLKTLTKLRVLDLGHSCQRMEETDVAWITTHLENLIKVEGVFYPDAQRHEELARRMRLLGMDVPVADVPETFFDNPVLSDWEDDDEEDDEDEYEDEYDYAYEEYEEGEETEVGTIPVPQGSNVPNAGVEIEDAGTH